MSLPLTMSRCSGKSLKDPLTDICNDCERRLQGLKDFYYGRRVPFMQPPEGECFAKLPGEKKE